MSDKRFKDTSNKRRDNRKKESTGKPFLQAPIILDRREKPEQPTHATVSDAEPSAHRQATQTAESSGSESSLLSTPFMRRPNRFNVDAILKRLADYPGNFVIGVVGKQGVGKSTILSQFTQDPTHVFPDQPSEYFLSQGHKTDGIDMYITPERAILLDTEPLLCWSVLDKALRNGSLGGLHPDLWLEMENLYTLVFLMSICNVILVVNDGPEVDMDLLKLIQRAEMLKFCIPDFPLLMGQQDMQYYPEVVFVCNKCTMDEFTCRKYSSVQSTLESIFEKSQLKTKGLANLGKVLPLYNNSIDFNLFFLPQRDDIGSFYDLVTALRDQVIAAPRRQGKKGQVSEKEWFRNAVKTYDLVRKSDYIMNYLQVVRKLRDS